MSNQITFTKFVRNPALMVSSMQNLIQTNTIDYFTYDEATSVINLIFKRNLDASNTQIVTTFITNYNENQVLNLTAQEMSDFKFAQFTMTKDTSITAPYIDVPFQSETYVDRNYFSSSARSYIYIHKPGTYLVMARVCTEYDNPQNALLQNYSNVCTTYELYYDDTRTEQGYLLYPDTNVYTTLHPNGVLESTVLSCVLNVNSPFGTFVRIAARNISGSAPVHLKGEFTSLVIMYIPNASYFEGVVTAASTAVPTTYQNQFIGRRRMVQYPFTHNVGQASVTIQTAGWLLLLSKCTFMKTAGTDNSQAVLRFFSLGLNTALTGTAGYSTEVMTGTKTTSNYVGLIPVNAGTQITYQIMMTQGSNLVITGGESGFIAVFLNASLYPQLSLLNAFTDVTQTTGPVLGNNVPVDLTFTTLRTLQPPSPINTINFSTTTPEVLINDMGVFIICAHISINNPAPNYGYLTVYITTSVDGGATALPVAGSRVSRTIGRSDRTSASTAVIVPISTGHRVKVQAIISNSQGDIVQFADSCTLTLCKFSTTSIATSRGTFFGQNCHFISSKEPLTIATTTLVEKCRLVTSYIPAGMYRVASRINFRLQDSGDTARYVFTHIGPSGTSTNISNQTNTLQQGTFMSLDYIFIPEGVNTFTVQSCTQNGNTMVVSHGLIEMWRF